MVADLSVQIGKIRMKNPVMTASGTYGFGREYGEYVDLNRLGALVVKGITLEPCAGNPPPRICETPAGLLNAVGLQNSGLQTFIKEELPYLQGLAPPIIVNASAHTEEDFCRLVERLGELSGIDGIELNVSCPNVRHGGIAFGTDPQILYNLVSSVRDCTDRTLIVKLSPNVSDIVEVAVAAEKAGADALSLINTLIGMTIDIEKQRPVLANRTGGLSGPAIRPVAVRMVWEVSDAVMIPVIGMGGIVTAADALQFILAGASAVAVGSAHFANPQAALDVCEGIEKYLEERGCRLKEIIGAAKR
ncbi:MAG: dihydroorotate dehydrogenase [Dethiobacteria bacterium]|jgi:dihydroorotate dehydrogenase (NAD+) catalytic subunit|nr:dihydroorotate dehydrogenase [Bacillota bacterium]